VEVLSVGKSNLIIFPLFTMFLITLVSVQGFSGDTAVHEFYGSRDVTDNQIELFDNFVNDRYDEFGDPPWNSLNAWRFASCDYCGNSFWKLLNDNFGSEYKTGHHYMAELMLDLIDNVWEENAVRVDNEDVEYVISRDPQFIEEWEGVHRTQISYDDTLLWVGIFVGVAAVVGIFGIRIFGSGLAEVSVTFMIKITLFILLWLLLSATAFPYMSTIPDVSGIVYIVLSFVYAAGCFFNLTENGGE